jgi:hypothetical protein
MKKFILGLIIGIVFSAGSSVLAMSLRFAGSQVSTGDVLTVEEQINRGYLFNINTGEKLEKKKVLTLEERLKNVEDRLSKLENK